jgi:hypothetical protein
MRGKVAALHPRPLHVLRAIAVTRRFRGAALVDAHRLANTCRKTDGGGELERCARATAELDDDRGMQPSSRRFSTPALGRRVSTIRHDAAQMHAAPSFL